MREIVLVADAGQTTIAGGLAARIRHATGANQALAGLE